MIRLFPPSYQPLSYPHPVPGRRVPLILLALAALALLAIILRLAAGGPLPDSPAADAIRELRHQRALAGLIVGSALAAAGVLLQCLLRNPLASPDLLGLSAGSGLAIMLAQFVGFYAGHGIAAVGINGLVALAGALAALALVYTLAQRRGFLEPVTLILVGVIVGIVCSALSTIIQYQLPDFGEAARRWLLGALNDENQWPRLAVTGALTTALLALFIYLGPALDAASLSADEARAVGVPLARLRLTLFLGAGALSAIAITLAGPIGFVGLLCPHIARIVLGPRHRPLVLASALLGAALVIAADAFIKVINLGSGRLPIGVLTTLLGAPVLLTLLRRRAL